MQADQGNGEVFGAALGQQGAGAGKILLSRRLGQDRLLGQPRLVAGADLVRRRRGRPCRLDPRRAEQAFGLVAAVVGHQHDADALAAGPAGAAAAMQQHLAVARQL
ncbi:hypothetical protein, partial [Inquilinus limosus]|uniref:hypothetical protein n=1 Tax=Inquilinus limosus TaxID=171674 RepID=UPI00193099BD